MSQLALGLIFGFLCIPWAVMFGLIIYGLFQKDPITPPSKPIEDTTPYTSSYSSSPNVTINEQMQVNDSVANICIPD